MVPGGFLFSFISIGQGSFSQWFPRVRRTRWFGPSCILGRIICGMVGFWREFFRLVVLRGNWWNSGRSRPCVGSQGRFFKEVFFRTDGKSRDLFPELVSCQQVREAEFHPINGAVGSPGSVSLYSVDRGYDLEFLIIPGSLGLQT
jgi:hypothetical protein